MIPFSCTLSGRLFFSFFFLLLTCVESVTAEPIVFKPLVTSSSLPTNEIRNLYQDSEGYI